MSVLDLLAELRALGVRLEANGDRLRFHPRAAVNPALLAQLKAHKPALLSLLTGTATEPESSDAEWPAESDSSLWNGQQAAELRHAAILRINRMLPSGRTVTNDEWQVINKAEAVIDQAIAAKSLSAVTTACEEWEATIAAMLRVSSSTNQNCNAA